MLEMLPLLIVTLCISAYWLTVIAKIVLQYRQIRKFANVIPREKRGRLLRIVWIPLLICWNVFLWQALLNFTPEPGLLHWLAWPAALIVLVATGLTYICWHEMGRSWRVGINPKETTDLVTTGPYHYVLHPIYALSIALAIGTMLILPTLTMITIMLIHIVFVTYEALREEQHLIDVHGQVYLDYKKNVGRFFPRLNTLNPCSSTK